MQVKPTFWAATRPTFCSFLVLAATISFTKSQLQVTLGGEWWESLFELTHPQRPRLSSFAKHKEAAARTSMHGASEAVSPISEWFNGCAILLATLWSQEFATAKQPAYSPTGHPTVLKRSNSNLAKYVEVCPKMPKLSSFAQASAFPSRPSSRSRNPWDSLALHSIPVSLWAPSITKTNTSSHGQLFLTQSLTPWSRLAIITSAAFNSCSALNKSAVLHHSSVHLGKTRRSSWPFSWERVIEMGELAMRTFGSAASGVYHCQSCKLHIRVLRSVQ